MLVNLCVNEKCLHALLSNLSRTWASTHFNTYLTTVVGAKMLK
jgi:hypothetical protein